VETNIRTVYIHQFFAGGSGDDEDPNVVGQKGVRGTIHDRQIIDLLEQTLDRENPREFYWALMDYGSHLKATHGNPNRASKHYAKQSKFHGSRRQIRGQVIRLLGARPSMPTELQAAIPDERLVGVLADLVQEGLVQIGKDGIYTL
jgi:A/G-specific adenine glycosylase